MKTNKPKVQSLKSINLKIGFLASHNGTTMQGILNALKRKPQINATASVVTSNNSQSNALKYAKNAGIPAFHISSPTAHNQKAADKKIRDCLKAYKVNLVILSGYMKKIDDQTLKAFTGKILNVHPALLPKYAGLWGDSVHSAVLNSKDKVTGVTIHQIDSIYDHGPILLQSQVKVFPNDTVETLKKRVQKAEVRAFINLLTQIHKRKLSL